ncbi:MAG TPA: hypothetical protein VNR18_12935 [Hyphomicrobiales bacterium]|nr:hypothetical protein [Hyphomicrobiales bacterium]
MCHNRKKRRSPHQPPAPPRGASLLEVLVALALFVSGMLGVFALHTANVTQQHRAYLRTQALLLGGNLTQQASTNGKTDTSSDDAE